MMKSMMGKCLILTNSLTIQAVKIYSTINVYICYILFHSILLSIFIDVILLIIALILIFILTSHQRIILVVVRDHDKLPDMRIL